MRAWMNFGLQRHFQVDVVFQKTPTAWFVATLVPADPVGVQPPMRTKPSRWASIFGLTRPLNPVRDLVAGNSSCERNRSRF